MGKDQLKMGEGKDGGGPPGLFPPHLNPPPPWGEKLFFGSLEVLLKDPRVSIFTH